jgi:integrase
VPALVVSSPLSCAGACNLSLPRDCDPAATARPPAVGHVVRVGARPHDLRHAALSSWLAAGVPPTEVTARAGNSVKVLLTVYAKCLADQQDTYNDRISGLLDP